MDRYKMIAIIGDEYRISNTENGEYSYVKDAGNKSNLVDKLGEDVGHYMADIRFQKDNTVVIVETKQKFTRKDEDQLRAYVEEEKVLYPSHQIIGILANTLDDKIKVWKSEIDDDHVLPEEKVLDSMDHYVRLFKPNKQNDREKVLRYTYGLNELLHKMDIPETLRSQFVGTSLLYIKDMVKRIGSTQINRETEEPLKKIWNYMTPKTIRAAIQSTLEKLLDGSANKAKKIELLQKNVLDNQKVKSLSTNEWVRVLDYILMDIYQYINVNSAEGQDILNLFFIAFNKYTGKADKNQAFTPDHITEFMCRITGVDRTKRIFDGTCGSGSFLVQAMVKELADCRRGLTEAEAEKAMDEVKKKHIYGVEIEDKAYGLSTTNMLIHGDGNSNIVYANLFDSADLIAKAHPDIVLMNPPYNAKPKTIPERYKTDWGKAKDGKEDPTKGYVFVKFIADTVQGIARKDEERAKQMGYPYAPYHPKMAVLLPMSAAIGSKSILRDMKSKLLENNTLEAVFSLPPEIFYPGASVQACCMVFTLNEPHFGSDGRPRKETFFGYYKDDGFKKKKNLGRIEQFDAENHSIWKQIESRWIDMYFNRKSVPGLSAMHTVTGEDEWLCEAYMETDYSKLTEADFQQTVNNYLAYLVKEGRVYEA